MNAVFWSGSCFLVGVQPLNVQEGFGQKAKSEIDFYVLSYVSGFKALGGSKILIKKSKSRTYSLEQEGGNYFFKYHMKE